MEKQARTLVELIKQCGIKRSTVNRALGYVHNTRIYYLSKNPQKITICDRNVIAKTLGVDPLVIEQLIDCNCKKSKNK